MFFLQAQQQLVTDTLTFSRLITIRLKRTTDRKLTTFEKEKWMNVECLRFSVAILVGALSASRQQMIAVQFFWCLWRWWWWGSRCSSDWLSLQF